VQVAPTPGHLVSTVPNVPEFPLASRNPLLPPASPTWPAFPAAAATTFSPALLAAVNEPSYFLLDAMLRLHSYSNGRHVSL
jgi:hypothetical protein